MWDCIKCKCKAIAESLGFCPQCFEPKEDEVPKGTTGGASNANAEPGEPGYIEPEPVEVPAAVEPKPDAAAKVTAPAKPEPEKPAETPAKPETSPPAVVPPKPAATATAPAAPSFAPVINPLAKDS